MDSFSISRVFLFSSLLGIVLVLPEKVKGEGLISAPQRNANRAWATGNPSRDFPTLFEDQGRGVDASDELMPWSWFVFCHLGRKSSHLQVDLTRPGPGSFHDSPSLRFLFGQVMQDKLFSAHVSTGGRGRGGAGGSDNALPT